MKQPDSVLAPIYKSLSQLLRFLYNYFLSHFYPNHSVIKDVFICFCHK